MLMNVILRVCNRYYAQVVCQLLKIELLGIEQLFKFGTYLYCQF